MAHRCLRVLVADDAPEVARRVSALLRELEGVEVCGPFGDGAAALAAFHSQEPQVAVLDVDMPKGSGLDVLRAIRASGRDCRVIILTGHDERTIGEACLAAGADQFLSKARDLDRLVELVEGYRAAVND